MAKGRHHLVMKGGGMQSDPVEFEVKLNFFNHRDHRENEYFLNAFRFPDKTGCPRIA
jgi:hypothetical protein